MTSFLLGSFLNRSGSLPGRRGPKPVDTTVDSCARAPLPGGKSPFVCRAPGGSRVLTACLLVCLLGVLEFQATWSRADLPSLNDQPESGEYGGGWELDEDGRVSRAGKNEEATLLPTTRDEWIALIDNRLARQRDATASPSTGDLNKFDQDSVNWGQTAFSSSCTTCHEASRALEKSRTYSQWLSIVRRMAAKEGADIRSGDVVPIATYLGSRSQHSRTERGDDGQGKNVDDGEQSSSIYATLSPVWRGISDGGPLENPGFFPDAWIGAEWHSNGLLSARASACTSCHSDRNPSRGFSLELVEAVVVLDLKRLITGCPHEAPCDTRLNAEVRGGRFVVPFGAYSAMSHPGIYRTVSNPLQFNMGRRVGAVVPLQPVLPAPYADEGFDLHVSASFRCDISATMDFYAVNGLQGTGASIFNASRSYVDNNREPAVGGRVTLGDPFLRIGGSVMTGNLAEDGASPLGYRLAGADATARCEDWFRLFFEYAVREDDSAFVAGATNRTWGFVTEAEVRSAMLPCVSLLARYDTLDHRDAFFGRDSQERFTYGLNVLLPGASRLAINHEHWMLAGAEDLDVLGVRWTATF